MERGKDLDDWESIGYEYEETNSCFNCKHSKVPSNKEPCASCRNRSKWERGTKE